jgi:hypothetical protein
MVACPNGLARQDHQFGPQGTETLAFENNGSMPYFRQIVAYGIRRSMRDTIAGTPDRRCGSIMRFAFWTQCRLGV